MSSTIEIPSKGPKVSRWSVTGSLLERLRIASVNDLAARTARVPARSALGRWWRHHRRSTMVVGTLLVLAAVVQGVNMLGAPQAIDDEGVYVAQAWAIIHLHTLAPYTFWYDHPPLGWMQLALFDLVVLPFRSASSAVAVGREAMFVVQLVNVMLLWILAQRLRISRWATAVGILAFSFSPLAIQYHRSVYLDNIAVVWALLAFILALSPKRRLVSFAGAGLCLGVSVLSKETFLLLAPALGWQIWRTAGPVHRRYALAAAGALLGAALSLYVLYAALKVELVPNSGHVSLWTGITYQLFSRQGSGSIFTTGTLGHRTVTLWLRLDTVWPALVILATPFAWSRRGARPAIFAFVFQLLIVLKPGYLPVPFVIGMMPFAALVVAIGADVLWQGVPGTGRHSRSIASYRRWLGRGLLVVTVVAAATWAAPSWAAQDRILLEANQESPVLQAEAWVAANLPHDVKIIVDDTMWVDLVEDGFPRNNVVWYYKVGTDPDVEARAPLGWRSYQYVVSTGSMRTFPGALPSVDRALTNSVPVAVFGSGSDDVVVRRIVPQGLKVESETLESDAWSRASAGRQLVTNGSLSLSATAKGQLLAGQVELPLMTVIGILSANWHLSIANFSAPTVQANVEQSLGDVDITAIDGRPLAASSEVSAVGAEASSQQPPFRTMAQVIGTGRQKQLVLSMAGALTEPLPHHSDPSDVIASAIP